MKKDFKVGFLLCIILFLFAAWEISNAQNQKIEIVVENATVKAKPDPEGRIIHKPSLGETFNVKAKMGEWYEITVSTGIGVSITGYIHEMFVQVIPPPPDQASRMELAVSAAYLGGYSGNDMFYSENWTYGILQKIIERGSLKPVMEKPRGFDLSLNYMLTKDMGIQFRFDYNLKAGLTNAGKSSYNLNFQWADTTIGGLSKEWALTGDVALANISANFIYKYPASTRVLPFISAGLTLQAGRLKAGTSGGYAWSWFVPGETDTMQVIDFIDIPFELKSSFNKIGLNLGGGMDLFLSPQVALTIDARYFIAQKTKLKWQVQPGKYVFNNFNQWTFTVDTASALQIEDGIEPYMLNTSFYRISVGLKFVF